MALEMKDTCERCATALAHDGEAFICSYECTFCAACAAGFAGACPNCKGELVGRPQRSGEPRRPPSATRHHASVSWQNDGAVFIDQRYSRVHRWRFDGGLEVRASSSPHVVKVPMSDPAAVDPEEGFIAALSSCHMLWFLSLAAREQLVVQSYEDEAYASTLPTADGRDVLAHVVLQPRVVFSDATPCSLSTLHRLHHEAHRWCFLASALRYPLVVEPRVPG